MGKHMFVGIKVDKCTGCRVCEYVCSLEHCKSFNPTRSRIGVIRLYPNTNAAYTCRMCENPLCIAACPRKGAMVQDPETGVIRINDELCEGCDWCIKACEYGAIILEEKKARMCDLCRDREGGPACIEWCPEDALELTDDDNLSLLRPEGADQNQEGAPAPEGVR